MYDISELQPTGKNIAVAILVVTLLLVAVFCIGYMLGIRNAGDVSDHGGGADRTAGQLEQATANQRQLTSDLRTAAEQARGLGDSIEQGQAAVSDGAAAADRIAAANSDITGQVDEAGTIIERSQRILQEIRSRSEANQGAH